MAYQSKHIENFIEKVKKEAEEAAQAVFNKHNAKLQQMVENQVLDGQKFLIGMGTATIRDDSRDLPYDYAQKFLSTVSNTQYWGSQVEAGFSIGDVDKTKKEKEKK